MQEDAIVTCFKCEATASASCAAERDAVKNAPASLQPLAPELDEVRRAIPSLKCDTPRPSRYLPQRAYASAPLLGFTHSPPSRPLRSLAHKNTTTARFRRRSHAAERRSIFRSGIMRGRSRRNAWVALGRCSGG